MSRTSGSKYRAYSLTNYRKIPQIDALSKDEKFALEVVGHVLPFRTNNYVVNKLIDWDSIPRDPIYLLNFPQIEMLQPQHFEEMASVLSNGHHPDEIQDTANKIRRQLNPHPAGQLEHNVPVWNGRRMTGMQHKYRETVLFFPGHGQTCHAFCTFCFRWAQFVGMDDLKFSARNADNLIQYVEAHPGISDVLFTGGDPMVMRTHSLAGYFEPLLEAKIPHLTSIRIGTKSLSYWPYRFVTDHDADALLDLFRKVVQAGKHLSIMAHFNHPRELQTDVAREAIGRIRATGAEIRTQSPLLSHINDDPNVWSKMWRDQVNQGCVPYYMFLARDTGAQHYFGVPLVRAQRIFNRAVKQVSGLARTVRGPSMSCTPGKVQVLDVTHIRDEKVIALHMLQGRDPDWVGRVFFADYDEDAVWLDDLKPAFGRDRFFFEE